MAKRNFLDKFFGKKNRKTAVQLLALVAVGFVVYGFATNWKIFKSIDNMRYDDNADGDNEEEFEDYTKKTCKKDGGMWNDSEETCMLDIDVNWEDEEEKCDNCEKNCVRSNKKRIKKK